MSEDSREEDLREEEESEEEEDSEEERKEDPKVEIFIDPEMIRTIYRELEKCSIELDENPIEFGPRRLTGKVAQARNMLSKCQRIATRISKYMWEVKSAILRGEAILQMKTNDLLSNDPNVRARPSVSDRKAVVQVMLIEEIVKLDERKMAFVDLQMLSDTIKVKIKDLVDTQARLNSQIRLCRMEMESLGVKWGSKDPEASLELKPDSSISGIKLSDFLNFDEDEEEEIQLPHRNKLLEIISEEEEEEDPEEEEEELGEEEEEVQTLSLEETAKIKSNNRNLAGIARDSLESVDLKSFAQSVKKEDDLGKALKGNGGDESTDQLVDLIEVFKKEDEEEGHASNEDDLDDILEEL